jgi:hypothetical protein
MRKYDIMHLKKLLGFKFQCLWMMYYGCSHKLKPLIFKHGKFGKCNMTLGGLIYIQCQCMLHPVGQMTWIIHNWQLVG